MKNLQMWAVRLLIICVVALSSTSCVKSMMEKVDIVGFDNLELKGFSGASADILFRNDTYHKIKVEGVDIELKDMGKHVLTVSLADEIAIPRREKSVAVPTLWKLRDLGDPFKALSIAKYIFNGKMEDNLKVDVTVHAKVGPIKRTMHRNNLSVKDLMKRVKK